MAPACRDQSSLFHTRTTADAAETERLKHCVMKAVEYTVLLIFHRIRTWQRVLTDRNASVDLRVKEPIHQAAALLLIVTFNAIRDSDNVALIFQFLKSKM
ncbi:MAG: hypothetical protein Q9170_005948 [Blastenia crenularia]